ncbi:hypothetical protein PhCBS80983_g04223 [Powellomyces hirtus]|uniref:GPI-anchored wall transfer protein n=1 Tax=Powellomyces hirtus TaxID=109895 RepID=A0A507DZB1_9FUNG|nr:hypothetical protein PhCBS80983_g04223 [Powellomyces hirtus]
MDAAKKKAKEEHVTGHAGTTPAECQLMLVVTMLSYALWKTIANRYPSLLVPSVASTAFDFLILAVPFLVAVSTPWLGETIAFLSFLTAVFAFVPRRPKGPARKKQQLAETKATKPADRQHWPFLIAVRSTLQVVTAGMILMVDFQVFPRRYAKTETFGTSLMDLGVGMFIFTGGIVAGPRIQSSSMDRRSAFKNLNNSVRSCIPVLVLGVLRMVVTKSVNYQEHVTEYGAHWNFFLTLGLIPIFISAVQLIMPGINLAFLGGLVISVYTFVLEKMELQNYILTAPRTGLVSMNREGICSFLGYLTIYLIAAAIGVRMNTHAQSGLQKQLPNMIGELSALALAFYGITHVLTDVVEIPVSRRMANISYASWVLGACSAQVMGTALVDLLFGSHNVPILFKAVNRNQLAVFLLANVLTGVINMSIDTLSVPDIAAVLIVGTYVLVVGAFAVILDSMNITLKL